MSDVPQVQMIPASVVRGVAQALPEPGDFRERFPKEQEDLDTYISIRLDELDATAAEFAGRVAAALWAIYERSGEDAGLGIPAIDSRQVGALEPVARQLLGSLAASRAETVDQPFDAEWLTGLRSGPQPHVMGFLIGALRASRLGFDGEVIFEVAVVLLAVAGALEAAASRARGEADDR